MGKRGKGGREKKGEKREHGERCGGRMDVTARYFARSYQFLA